MSDVKDYIVSIGSGGYEKLDKFSYDKDYYLKVIDTQFRNGMPFAEQFVGSRRKLYKFGRFICTNKISELDLGGIKNRQFISFLGTFTKNIYNQFAENPKLYDKQIKFLGNTSKFKNLDVWRELNEGDVFFNIDFKNAYWQTLRRLGYIDAKFYSRYVLQDEYKKAKRYCVSFLGRSNKVVYHYPEGCGLPYGDYEISCDTSVLRNVYMNVRNEIYNSIYYAMSELESMDNVLGFNTDGIYVVDRKSLDIVKSKLMEMGIIFKSSICKKINDYEYIQESTVRTFAKRIR